MWVYLFIYHCTCHNKIYFFFIFHFTIVTSVCCATIVWTLIFQGTVLLRFIFGPLPPMACFWHFLLRKTLVNQHLLLFDGIILMQYIFIFWVKNPSTFQDEFWNLFLNLWVILFSSLWYLTLKCRMKSSSPVSIRWVLQ